MQSRVGLSLVFVLSVALLVTACAGTDSSQAGAQDSWEANLLEPAALVKELASAEKPVVLCTAPPFMYRAGHIPGAVLHGPMTEPGVRANLTTWAQPLARDTKVVVYCGCCPLNVCPNVRPAFTLLKEMGFTNVRVLNLRSNFPTDWTNRGYPVEK